MEGKKEKKDKMKTGQGKVYIYLERTVTAMVERKYGGGMD